MSGRDWNESAASFGWVARTVGLFPGPGSGVATETWQSVRDRMRVPVDQSVTFSHDWISDPWVARGAKQTVLVTVAPFWDPPDALDEWPNFDAERLIDAIATDARQTRHQTFRELLDTPRAIQADDAVGAVARFLQMESEIERHGDTRMVQGEHLRAWLLAAVGPLLRGVMLAGDVAEDELTRATVERLAMPFAYELTDLWILANEYGEKHLDLIYNLSMTPTGLAPIDETNIRVGQGEAWREAWGWLSRTIEPDEMYEAIQLTARVMRCAPVLEGLLRALRSDQPGLATVALCVLRRWLLTLKVMSWLEASVLQTWSHIRPQDLACFAFNAVKPDWPRRILAVSHRSTEAKPELSTMKLWRSSRCAIDASYVPSWETNTGMVWGLFGVTPAIVRVRSSGYDASIWCLREAELTQHLVERLDFVAERWVVDVDVSNVRVLDDAVALWHTGDEAPDDGLAEVLPEFPPMCEVWTPSPMPAWEVKIWRASAALRAINVWAAWDPELTNRIAQELLSGTNDLPFPAPTNNPAGWRDYASIFQELHAVLGDDASEAALRIPSAYGPEAQERDLELLQRVPDLSSGTPALGDVLVALEFLRTERPIIVDDRRTRFIAINCRGLSRETFTDDERLSLHRGLLEIRVPVPVWIIQSAEEHVEQWGLRQDPPIFTEHEPHQFSWMYEFFVDRREAQSRYPEESELELSPALLRLCRDGR